ncbi:hypothetical protein BGZ92_006538, partial [Podila epicladia]
MDTHPPVAFYQTGHTLQQYPIDAIVTTPVSMQHQAYPHGQVQGQGQPHQLQQQQQQQQYQ